MRKYTSLNFGWKYSEEYTTQSMLSSFDDSDFETVDIPHANKEIPLNDFDERMYQFVSSYRKHFRIDREKLGSDRVLLHFEGVANYCDVYLNDEKLGSHQCAYTAFTFDITDKLLDGENLLAVCVDSTERDDVPPFGNVVDYLCYGGIYREVWLEKVSETYIEDVFVRTRNVLSAEKYLDVDVTFNKAFEGELKIALLDGDEVIKTHTCQADAKLFKFKWKTKGTELWSVENPKLYKLRITAGADEKTVTFGYRECKFTKNGFYLNGRHIKIRGLNRHQAYPYVGYAMPKSAQRADADFLKYTLGVNFVRTSHYPDSRHFIERCNEIGLLVFTEIPSWQHIGTGVWRENCLKNTRDMVMRDRNDPCVVLWGVRVNESPDCDELYIETNKIARELDDTRQTGGVRNMPQGHFFEDVYTYNDFVHSGKRAVLLPPLSVSGNKPYLVTEHNGHMFPTKSFDREEIRLEHALRHARVLNKAYSDDRWCGAVGWCMSDYNTHKQFGSGDKICYHGVADMFRVPKLAGMFYASQQDETPVLAVSSSMDIGEHPACEMGDIYAFTNCDEVKIYKNDKYVTTLYPDRKNFPFLPHPPVLLNDFVGNLLVEEEGITKVGSALLKPMIAAAVRESWHFSPLYYLPTALGVVTSGKSIPDMIPVIEKYIGGWGGSKAEYSFVGVKNGEEVIKVNKSTLTELTLSVKADSTELIEDDTYDVTRIELRALDQNGNQPAFASNAVRLSATGPIEIIGPETIALIGGDRAFWVRTKGKSGKGIIKISAEGIGEYFINVNCTKVKR